MPTPYPTTDRPSFTLHAADWHAGCPVSPLVAGGRVMLWCERCRCLASAEAVSEKVDILASAGPVPGAATSAGGS